MKEFLEEDFLLSNEVSKKLFHQYAQNMPIIDYHCHLNPKDIYEDKRFENITQMLLSDDHYKWRLMRSDGVEENEITKAEHDYEKFLRWAETLERAIGNPLYHWSHLELKKYFGYEGYLTKENAKEVWDYCNKKIKDNDISVRKIIAQSNVQLLCTTDDPIDSLKWHKKLQTDKEFEVKVLPTFRPDKALNMEKQDFLKYISKLEKASGVIINSVHNLFKALQKRMDIFEKMGCRSADHGLSHIIYSPADEKEVEAIFQKRLLGKIPGKEKVEIFKTALLIELGKEYAKRGWVMQLHFGVKRDTNQYLYKKLGPDAGVDCINNENSSEALADFLNALDETKELPKTILYSLNPTDNAMIGTVLGCFQDATVKGKIQQGSAWWFQDHKEGMTAQMTSLANLGLLSNFIGMLTDSRSFLSYVRHEYFRRILCNLIGEWVENGEYPKDYQLLEKIVKDISYHNVQRYFGFDLNL